MTKNITISVLLKILQAFFGFAILHQLISTWGTERYGIWITMTSAITYMTMLDFGVGYGIKNRVSEAAAHSTPASRAELVPTIQFGVLFYAGISALIIIFGLAIVPAVSPFKDHKPAAAILWTASSATFFLSYANIILQGESKFGRLNAFALIVPLSWCLIVTLTKDQGGLPLTLAASVYAALLIIQGSTAFVAVRRLGYFQGRMRFSWNPLVAQPLLTTGIKFFLLQIASLTLFYSGNLLIFYELGPAEVARYDAATKVFSIFTVGFSVLLTVAWTEISMAKARSDGKRLRAVLAFLGLAAILAFGAAALVSWQSNFFVLRLTGVTISPRQTAPFALLAGLQSLAFAGAVFLNAFEELKGQLVLALLSIPGFFAAAYFMFGRGFGMEAVPLATAITMLPAVIYCWSRALKIIRRFEGRVSPSIV